MDINKTIDEVVNKSLYSRSIPGVSRDIQKGLNKHTEHYAYQHIIHLIDSPKDETRLIRIAGLIASSKVSQGNVSFGEWVYKNCDDKVKDRMMRLMNLQFDQAIVEISRIIGMNKSSIGSFNWYQLARTLFYWGNGVSDTSLEVRQRIVKDYFRVYGTTSDEVEDLLSGDTSDDTYSENDQDEREESDNE